MNRHPIRQGRCQLCGCTSFAPCPGGCGWLNVDRILCTRCAALIVRCAAELLRQGGWRRQAPSKTCSSTTTEGSC